MKKSLFLALALCLLMLAGCGRIFTDGPVPQAATADWGITVSVEGITSKGCTMVIAQSGGDGVGELMCGLNYLLQGLTEGGWQSVRTKEDLEVPSIGYMLNDQTHTFAVDWTRVHGELPAGTYRIGKNITNHTKLDQRETQCVYSEPFIIGE